MLVELERLTELQASTAPFRTDETSSNGRPNSFISVTSSTSEVVEEIECLVQEPGSYNCVLIFFSVIALLSNPSSKSACMMAPHHPSPNSACMIAPLHPP